MKADTIDRSELERLDEGEWLSHLLVDIQKDVVRQPTQAAVGRIRNRLFRQMRTPTRAAA